MIRFLVLFCLLSGTAHAHNKSISFSDWLWNGRDIEVIFTVAARDITFLPQTARSTDLASALGNHLQDKFELRQINTACTVSEPFDARPARAGYVRMQATFRCLSENAALQVTNNVFFDMIRTHIHLARIQIGPRRTMQGQEVLFTTNQRTFSLNPMAEQKFAPRQNFFEALGRYFRLGVEHIATGIDHLAFVLCLVLLATSVRRLLILVSGFTLGHSLTLALSALGVVAPNASIVEAVIGASIAALAAEGILTRAGLMPRAGLVAAALIYFIAGLSIFFTAPLPLAGWAGFMLFAVSYGFAVRTEVDRQAVAPIITAAFGLFHGFGFAGLLNDVGLPEGQVLSGLLGFNLGVEFGQLLFIFVILLPLRMLLQDLPSPKIRWSDILASILTGYGVFLFVQRGLL